MLRSMLGQFGKVIKENPITFTLNLVFSAGKIASEIIPPLEFVNGIESLAEGDEDNAIKHLLIFAAVWTASSLIPLLQTKLLIPRGTELGSNLTLEAGKAFFNMPKEIVDPNKGESYKFVNQYGGSAQPGGVAHSLLPVTNDVVTSLAEMAALNAFMWYKLGEVTWLSSLQTALFIASLGPMAKKIADGVIGFIEDLYKGFSHAIVFANGYESNILCNQQEEALKRFHSYLLEKLNPSTQRYLNINLNSLSVPAILGGSILISQLVYAVKKDLLTPSEFILLIFYSRSLTLSTEKLTQRLIEGISSFGLFYTIMQYIAQGTIPNAKEFHVRSKKADIVIDKISYTYPNSKKQIFNELSLNIKPRQVVALTGLNGTGKSTLFQMLYGFAKPDKGQIRMGGSDIAELNPNSLRAACAIIPQDPPILPGTFRHNIKCNYPDATEEDVLTVMKATGLSPKFSPDKVIEFSFKGPEISGGEKQRLVIARTLLAIKKGKIKYLFCDEGVAALDQQGKDFILSNLKKIIEKHHLTTFIITHDLGEMQKYISFDEVLNLNELNKQDKKSLKHSANKFKFFQDSPEKSRDTDSRKEEKMPMEDLASSDNPILIAPPN